MQLQNYFKITLEVQNAFNINNVNVVFNSIEMTSEEFDTPIIISNRHNIFTIEKNTSNIVYLYIKNDGNKINERIDYLLDEEWVISKLDAIITENNINLKYIIRGYEQVVSLDYDSTSGFVADFLSKKYVNNTICILGPKPDKLYGYNMYNSQYANLKKKIVEKVEPLLNFIKNIILTNGYIGGEMIGFEIALQLKSKYQLTNILAIPFKNIDNNWIDETKRKYQKMLQLADEVIEIDKIENYKYGMPEVYTKEKFIKKNEFDVDYANTFIVINDKEDTLKSLKKRIIYANKTLIEVNAYDDLGLKL